MSTLPFWSNYSDKPCLCREIFSTGNVYYHNPTGESSTFCKVPRSPEQSVLTTASPQRLWKVIRGGYSRLRTLHTPTLGTLRNTVLNRNFFRNTLFPGYTSLVNISLDGLCATEIEERVGRLRGLREKQAAGLGLLVSDGMEGAFGDKDWREGVGKGVRLMVSIMNWLMSEDTGKSNEDVEAGNDLVL